MTDQNGSTPDGGPVLQLPERPQLDPISAAALAVAEKLTEQAADAPEAGAMVLDPRALAEAALAGIEGLPRVPRWTEPREIGGASAPGDAGPDPAVRIGVDGEFVTLTVSDDRGEHEIGVDPTDAEGWFLAGLAAVAQARRNALEDDPDA
jgi:hypothetical protein